MNWSTAWSKTDKVIYYLICYRHTQFDYLPYIQWTYILLKSRQSQKGIQIMWLAAHFHPIRSAVDSNSSQSPTNSNGYLILSPHTYVWIMCNRRVCHIIVFLYGTVDVVIHQGEQWSQNSASSLAEQANVLQLPSVYVGPEQGGCLSWIVWDHSVHRLLV